MPSSTISDIEEFDILHIQMCLRYEIYWVKSCKTVYLNVPTIPAFSHIGQMAWYEANNASQLVVLQNQNTLILV